MLMKKFENHLKEMNQIATTLIYTEIINTNITWPGTVAHKSNPSYFGGRDQENLGLRSIWAKTY
jgi:hypothetical protein